MSLQSMFNQMIGNIGVQSSILKNRLRPEEETPSKSQKKAPSGASKEKTSNDTSDTDKAAQKAPERPKKANEKMMQVSAKDYAAFKRMQKRTSTLQNQVKELELRKKELEKIMDTSYGGAL